MGGQFKARAKAMMDKKRAKMEGMAKIAEVPVEVKAAPDTTT